MSICSKKIKKEKSFEMNTMIVFILSMVASAINYIFQIITGRMLGTSEYGVVNVVLSYVSYLGVFIGPISVMACNYATVYKSTSTNKLKTFVKWILKIAFTLEIIVSAIGLPLSWVLYYIKGQEGYKILFFVMLLLPMNSFYSIVLGIMQGMQEYKIYGIIGILFNSIKLILSVFFIYCGRDSISIVIGMFISQIVCVGISITYLQRYLYKQSEEEITLSQKDILKYYGEVFFLQIIYYFFVNGGDIILLRFFFDNEIVGLYSSASTLSKMVIYVVSPITIVLLPMVVEQHTLGEQTIGILFKALSYSCFIALFFLGVINAFGKRIIQMLYGESFYDAFQYLPASSIYVFSLVVLSVIYQYQIAINKVKGITGVILVATIVCIILTLLVQFTPISMIAVVGIAIIITCIINIGINIKGKSEKFF